MTGPLRWFLFVEAVAFALASLVHAGILMSGYEHSGASIPEGIIAGILGIGLLVSLGRPV